MSRSCASLGLLVLFLASALAWSEQPAGIPVAKPIKDSARALREKLTRPVTFEKGLDPNTKFKDAMDFIADRYELSIAVDDQGFANAMPGMQMNDAEVRLPRMVGVRLSTILRMLVEQVGGIYLIQADHILIAPLVRSQPAKWKDEQRSLAVRVDAQFDQLPLKDALQDLADQSGLSLVLDPTLDADKRPVSITLSNVPVDTAVRVLADMVNAKMVALDNVLYVTSFEKAEHLQLHTAKPAPKKEKKSPHTVPSVPQTGM